MDALILSLTLIGRLPRGKRAASTPKSFQLSAGGDILLIHCLRNGLQSMIRAFTMQYATVISYFDLYFSIYV